MATADEPFDSRDLRDVTVLWFGVLAPPAAFLLNLQMTYALVPSVCESTRVPHAVLHVVTLFWLGMCVAAGVRAWRNVRRAGGRWPDDQAGPVDRSRLLGALGLMSSAFFGLVIVALWIPTFLLSACARPT